MSGEKPFNPTEEGMASQWMRKGEELTQNTENATQAVADTIAERRQQRAEETEGFYKIATELDDQAPAIDKAA